MKVINVTADEKRHARLAGFRKKKPKKPKSRTTMSIERYIDRYNSWAKELKSKAIEGKKIEAMRKTITNI